MTSLFNNPLFIPKEDNVYVSFEDWLNESQMGAVLKELSKCYPDTKYLYDKYLQKILGWTDNKINTFEIIYYYSQIINHDFINDIIINYKKNGDIFRNNIEVRKKDKQIFLYILNSYKTITTNSQFYNILNNIVELITNDIIEPDPFIISKMLNIKVLTDHYKYILTDIINYRLFGPIAKANI